MEIDYSVYVLRQLSRRSWRIGQRQPVEVTFLTHEGTLQAEALPSDEPGQIALLGCTASLRELIATEFPSLEFGH